MITRLIVYLFHTQLFFPWLLRIFLNAGMSTWFILVTRQLRALKEQCIYARSKGSSKILRIFFYFVLFSQLYTELHILYSTSRVAFPVQGIQYPLKSCAILMARRSKNPIPPLSAAQGVPSRSSAAIKGISWFIAAWDERRNDEALLYEYDGAQYSKYDTNITMKRGEKAEESGWSSHVLHRIYIASRGLIKTWRKFSLIPA